MSSPAATTAPTTAPRRARAFAHLLLPIVSAVLLAAAFPPLEWSYLAWIALLPLCVVLVDKVAFIETYLGAYLGGILFQMLTLDWLRTAYGGSGISGDHALNWLLVSVVLGLFWPLFMLVGRRLARTDWPMFVLLPLLWTSLEFARKYSWALLVDQTGNPWSQIGYTQLNHLRLVQIADLAGVYAVTFLVAAVNGALWDVLSVSLQARKPRLPWSAVAAATLVATAWLYGQWRLHEPLAGDGPTITLMPAWTPKFTDHFTENDRSDILLWSELNADQTLWDLSLVNGVSLEELAREAQELLSGDNVERDFGLTELFEDQARDVNATLVIGCERLAVERSGSRKFNSLACVHPERGYQGCYDKKFLVPWTEFTPRSWFKKIYGKRSRGYSHGDNCPLFSTPLHGEELPFAVSICFDNCFPELYRQAMQSDPKPAFFLHAGAEGQDRSYRLARNMFNMARFRAIESRRAIVRNTVHGYSGVIDSNGRPTMLLQERLLTTTALLGAIPLDTRVSLYTRYGDWLPWLCGVLVLLLLPFTQSLARTVRK